MLNTRLQFKWKKTRNKSFIDYSLDYINMNIMLQDIFAQTKCHMNFTS